ncbi:hypothetical protein DENSPDRAFT_696704 [Dentipellis sp. KUC8613]|nr:hypothetical protein DENSPDRAFT_696704 [Dentipellis sp. KUC8613]
MSMSAWSSSLPLDAQGGISGTQAPIHHALIDSDPTSPAVDARIIDMHQESHEQTDIAVQLCKRGKQYSKPDSSNPGMVAMAFGHYSNGSGDEMQEQEQPALYPSTRPMMSNTVASMKVEAIAKDFFTRRSIVRGKIYWSSLPPAHHFRLVDELVMQVIMSYALNTDTADPSTADAELVANFLAHARENNFCRPASFRKGLMPLVEIIDDIVIDAPKALDLFAVIIKGTGLQKKEKWFTYLTSRSTNRQKLQNLLAVPENAQQQQHRIKTQAAMDRQVEDDVYEFFHLRSLTGGSNHFQHIFPQYRPDLARKLAATAPNTSSDTQLLVELLTMAVERGICSPEMVEQGLASLGEEGTEDATQLRSLDTKSKKTKDVESEEGLRICKSDQVEALQHRWSALLSRLMLVKEKTAETSPALETGSSSKQVSQRRQLQLFSLHKPSATMVWMSIVKKIDEDAKEFFSIRSIDEAENYFSALLPAHRFRLVDKLAMQAVESKAADAVLVANLFKRAREKDLCSPEAFEEGLTPLAEIIDDVAIDAPKALELFAVMVKGAGLDKDEEWRTQMAGKSMYSAKPQKLFATSGKERDRTRSKRGEKRSDSNRVSVGHQPQMSNMGSMGLPLEPVSPLEMTANRWIPTSTKRNAPVDQESPEIVDRKVKALLNKLTMERFDSISDRIVAWANKSEKEKDGRTLIQVVRLVFEKATDEATFSEMYARLCRKMMEMISTKVQNDGIKNTEGKPITGGLLFRKYLLNRCQEDFERGWEATAAAAATKATDDQAAKEAAKSTEGKDGKENKEESELYSDEYYAAAKAKRRGLGLIRFIGELFKLQMLTERIMHECIQKLFGNVENPEEEEIESLCELLTTVGQSLDTQKAHARMDLYFSRMKELCKSGNVNSRMQVMLQDIIELRVRKWVPRNQAAAPVPTTIAQIHEAVMISSSFDSIRFLTSLSAGCHREEDRRGREGVLRYPVDRRG